MGGEDTRKALAFPRRDLGKIFHFTAELGLRRFPHGFGELEECGLRRGIVGHGYDGMSLSAATTVAGSERDRAEEVQPFLFGEGFAAALLGEIDSSYRNGGQKRAASIFSTRPSTSALTTLRNLSALRTSASEISCGGDDDALGVGMASRMVICSSPVPGGIDEQIVQRAPLHVGDELLNGSNLLGPRQMMAASLSSRKDSMEMSERRSPQETGTRLAVFVIHLTNPWEPSRCGTLGPCKSTSRMPTLKPLRRQRGGEVHGY